MQPDELQFQQDISALVEKYRGSGYPGYQTLWSLSLSHHRGDYERLRVIDEATQDMERDYLESLFFGSGVTKGDQTGQSGDLVQRVILLHQESGLVKGNRDIHFTAS